MIHVRRKKKEDEIKETSDFLSFQSPPWIFIEYHQNESLSEGNNSFALFNSSSSSFPIDEEMGTMTVTGGRDDNLIKLLATKLNFKFRDFFISSSFTL